MYVNPYAAPAPLSLKLKAGKQVGPNLVPKGFQAGPTFSEPIAGKAWTSAGVVPLNTYLPKGTKTQLPKTGGPTMGGEAGNTTPGLPAGVAPPPPDSPGNDNSAADPAIDMVRSLYHKRYLDSISAGDAQRKQVGIDLGDPAFVHSLVFGGMGADEQHTGDVDTELAAAQNPYSTLATLRKGYMRDAWQDDENKNKQNLFYGGAREKSQAQLLDTFNRNNASAYSDAHTKLDAIAAGIKAAWDEEQAKVLEAQLAAAKATMASPNTAVDTSGSADAPAAKTATAPAVSKAAATKTVVKAATPATRSISKLTKTLKGYF